MGCVFLASAQARKHSSNPSVSSSCKAVRLDSNQFDRAEPCGILSHSGARTARRPSNRSGMAFEHLSLNVIAFESACLSHSEDPRESLSIHMLNLQPSGGLETPPRSTPLTFVLADQWQSTPSDGHNVPTSRLRRRPQSFNRTLLTCNADFNPVDVQILDS